VTLILLAAACAGSAPAAVVAVTATATAPAAATATPAAATLAPAPTAPPSTPPTLRLLFTGDIDPGRCPAQIALAHDDFTLPYLVVGEALRAADITIGSLDGALSDISPPGACPASMNLIGPARTVEGLQYAGFEVLSVATNHAKDCGTRGWGCGDRSFVDTLAHLEAAGIGAAGGGSTVAGAEAPVIVERQGVRFAFLGVTAVGEDTWAGGAVPGTAPLSDADLPAVLASVRAARVLADVVVVLPHWGVEYAEAPSAEQLRWAGDLVDAGATLVIGNHPHVAQPVEAFRAADGRLRGVAAYALGNFVFDQGPWRTRQGVLFEATFRGADLVDWRLRPIHIRSLHQPWWADEAEARAILARVEAASAALPAR
jgi:poly-gamma-glutamate capsule biosynthesis protein CapA/YwtB (metallophosphatase superfamily)